MENKISWWRTKFDEEDIQKVRKSILNEHISMGSVTEEFEKKIAESLDIPYALVTTSGTVALLMACMALGITKGDEVIIQNRTWIATANAPHLLGAKIVLVDCEKDKPIINADKIEEKITKKTKAIVPVHLNGRDSNIEKVNEIAEKHGLFVIEDACQAMFSKNKLGYLGTQSDIGFFSLSIAKLISSGGQGGVLVTKNKRLYEKLKLIRNNGTRSVMVPKYESLGCNFKFTDIQASIGLVQLSKKQEKISHIKKIYNKYAEAIQSLSYIKLIPVDIEKGELPLYVEILCKERSKLKDFLESKNIYPRLFLPSLDTADYLEKLDEFPNSKLFAEQGLFLPCGSAQPLENIDYVINNLKSFENVTQNNLNEWKLDQTGKSSAYFSKTKNPSLNQGMLNKLKEISVNKGKVNLRFCLHNNSNENLQDMVILAYKEKICKKPHKHTQANEAISLIEGEMLALMFDDDGKLINKKLLTKKGDFIYRNPQNTYHLFLPVTDFIIYREIIGGKFEPAIFPKWDYVKILQKEIDMDLECKNSSCNDPCSFNNILKSKK